MPFVILTGPDLVLMVLSLAQGRTSKPREVVPALRSLTASAKPGGDPSLSASGWRLDSRGG